MRKYISISFLTFLSVIYSSQYSYSSEGTRADDHAPISVMGEHIHEKGEWMVSYRYMRMEMEGNRDGNRELTNAETRARGFAVAPTDMSMDMHMFGIMRGITNNLTIMAMIPYLEKSMNHETRNGTKFKVKTHGLGDIKLSALYSLIGNGNRDKHNFHINVGASFPTGEIDELGDEAGTPVYNNTVPYPMQLGSGTIDSLLGATYVFKEDSWSLGMQLNTVFRLGRNSANYSLGNQIELSSWIAKNINRKLSSSLRLKAVDKGNYDGSDARITLPVPTARANLRGGSVLNVGVGFNYLVTKKTRLALEYLQPIYQYLDGPQLQEKESLTLGYQFLF